MANEDNILASIQILTQAKDEVAELLKETPMLSIRVENTLGLLIRGINHANGFNAIASTEEPKEKKQMSNFYGLDVEEIKNQDVPAVVDVTQDEKEIFMQKIQEIYDGFLERDEKEIVESVSKLQILGVAKLAGIEVENPASQNITQTFVKSIKKAIQDKKDTEAKRATEKAKLTDQNPAGTTVDLKKDTKKETDGKTNTEPAK